jgi:hypothetical protein
MWGRLTLAYSEENDSPTTLNNPEFDGEGYNTHQLTLNNLGCLISWLKGGVFVMKCRESGMLFLPPDHENEIDS